MKPLLPSVLLHLPYFSFSHLSLLTLLYPNITRLSPAFLTICLFSDVTATSPFPQLYQESFVYICLRGKGCFRIHTGLYRPNLYLSDHNKARHSLDFQIRTKDMASEVTALSWNCRSPGVKKPCVPMPPLPPPGCVTFTSS